MKSKTILIAAITLICCITCSCVLGESSFVLPTQEPSETGAEFVLPIIPDQNKQELPDPTLYMVKSTKEPVHQSDHYETNGKIYDVWYYPDATFPLYVYSHYKDDCEAAGFTVTKETISEQTAYAVRGDKEAYIFPEYNGAVMTMIEEGMTFSKILPGDEWAYVTTDDSTWSNQKTIRYYTDLSLNDADGRTLNGGKMYRITIKNSNEKIQQYDFSIPAIAKAGDKYYAGTPITLDGGITYEGIDPGINLTVYPYGKDPELYVFEVVPPSSVGLLGANDYLILTINDVNRLMRGKQINGEIIGMFKNLSEVLVINFSVVVPD